MAAMENQYIAREPARQATFVGGRIKRMGDLTQWYTSHDVSGILVPFVMINSKT